MPVHQVHQARLDIAANASYTLSVTFCTPVCGAPVPVALSGTPTQVTVAAAGLDRLILGFSGAATSFALDNLLYVDATTPPYAGGCGDHTTHSHLSQPYHGRHGHLAPPNCPPHTPGHSPAVTLDEGIAFVSEGETALVAARNQAGIVGGSVKPGELLHIYGTTGGLWLRPPKTFGPVVTIGDPAARLGDAGASLIFSGLAHHIPGAWRIDVRVPDNLPAGTTLPLTVVHGGRLLNQLSVTVEQAFHPFRCRKSLYSNVSIRPDRSDTLRCSPSTTSSSRTRRIIFNGEPDPQGCAMHDLFVVSLECRSPADVVGHTEAVGQAGVQGAK